MLKVNSEFGTLKSLLVHRPGKEIDRLTPYNVKELLFEDVPYLEDMQHEHDEFTSLIKSVAGTKIYRLHDLLTDIFSDRKIIIDAFKTELEEVKLEHLAEDITERFSSSQCVTILLAGLKVKELKKKFYHKDLTEHENREFIIKPNPNLYFMRDPAIITPSGVISSQLKFPARQKESLLMKLVFENHTDFKEHFNLIYPKKSYDGNVPCIEGGDVIILSEKAIAIGQSERTDSSAIIEVSKELLKLGKVERIYEVVLPKKRNFMHLDTVFSIIDENLIVTYPDALSAVLQTKVHKLKNINELGEVELITEEVSESILDLLKKEIPYLDIIETGDGNVDYSSREQWFDGANVFAIGPRRVISYNRNKHTNRALKDAGVEVIEIRASELVRGLGGPRCMTMPLERGKV